MYCSNLKEAKELLQLYNSIVEGNIKIKADKDVFEFYYVITNITGFGSHSRCLLCRAVNQDCYKCIYSVVDGGHCNTADSSYSYIKLRHGAGNLDEFLYAVKNRANYLESIIKKYEANNE